MYAAQYAAVDPHKPAIVMATSGEVITFGEYEAASNRMAHLYRDQGLQRLDHVAFFMENNPRMLECEGGAERSGEVGELGRVQQAFVHPVPELADAVAGSIGVDLLDHATQCRPIQVVAGGTGRRPGAIHLGPA